MPARLDRQGLGSWIVNIARIPSLYIAVKDNGPFADSAHTFIWNLKSRCHALVSPHWVFGLRSIIRTAQHFFGSEQRH